MTVLSLACFNSLCTSIKRVKTYSVSPKSRSWNTESNAERIIATISVSNTSFLGLLTSAYYYTTTIRHICIYFPNECLANAGHFFVPGKEKKMNTREKAGSTATEVIADLTKKTEYCKCGYGIHLRGGSQSKGHV